MNIQLKGGLNSHLTCLIPYFGKFKTLKSMNLASNSIYSQCYKVKCETVINSKILLCLIALFYLFAITGLRKTLLLSF